MKLPLRAGAVLGLLKEVRSTSNKPMMVGGTLADQLARELSAGGDATAVRVGDEPRDVEVFVYVIGDSVTDDDERVLKRAHRSHVPTIVVAAGRKAPRRIPFVLATDLVRAQPGHGFPVEEIARAIARKIGEEATSLARRLPVMRPAVSAQLISSFSRKNGLIGAAVFVPGVDLPVLTLHQLRMVVRILSTHGLELDGQRAPELLATLGAGFGFRAIARELLNFIPVFGWAVKGAVAYAGTRAIGEATVRYSEARHARLRRRSRLQLLLLRPDRPQPLMEPGPRPWLELLVPDLELTPGGLEVLEPGVRLLDQQQLVGISVRHAAHHRTGTGRRHSLRSKCCAFRATKPDRRASRACPSGAANGFAPSNQSRCRRGQAAPWTTVLSKLTDAGSPKCLHFGRGRPRSPNPLVLWSICFSSRQPALRCALAGSLAR